VEPEILDRDRAGQAAVEVALQDAVVLSEWVVLVLEEVEEELDHYSKMY
jgi:hypothetical protein